MERQLEIWSSLYLTISRVINHQVPSKINLRDDNRIMFIIHCHQLVQGEIKVNLRYQDLNMCCLKMIMIKISKISTSKICVILLKVTREINSNQWTLELITMVWIRCQRTSSPIKTSINPSINPKSLAIKITSTTLSTIT